MRLYEITEENDVWRKLLDIDIYAISRYATIVSAYENLLMIDDHQMKLAMIQQISLLEKSFEDIIKEPWVDETDIDIQTYHKELENMCIHLTYMKKELFK